VAIWQPFFLGSFVVAGLASAAGYWGHARLLAPADRASMGAAQTRSGAEYMKKTGKKQCHKP